MFDVQKFTDGIFEYLKLQFEPIVNRIKALEQAPTIDLEKQAENVKKQVEEAVEKAMASVSNGRDALDIEILPFDENKSYPRGTYVSHRGGVMRAFQTTEGTKGFDVILNGVAEQYYGVEDDKRTFTFSTELTDGTVFEQKTVIPVLIYKGIWTDLEVYSEGDVVTYDGCSWVAEAEVKGKPGTADSGFKLMVKKGRDKSVARFKD